MLTTLITALILTPTALIPWGPPPIAWTLAAAPQQTDRAAATAPQATPQPPAEPTSQEINEADPAVALLREVQRAEHDLVAFTAKLKYWTEEALMGSRVLRSGEFLYHRDPTDGQRRVAMLFDHLIDLPADGGRAPRLDRKREYIFSGRWLVEVDHYSRHFIKREIVAPGQTFDPFKLGEGPFPLPVGQAPEEVLQRFDVALVELPEDTMLGRLNREKTDGLRLTPKPDTKIARDVKRIDLYYDRATRLPVGVALVERNGDRKIARLDAPERNPAVTAEMLGRLDVSKPPPDGWKIDVTPWSGGDAAANADPRPGG